MRNYSSRSQCGPRRGRLDRQAEGGELSQTPRMRNLAGFLGFDPQIVADGIVEAARRDPSLRVQRI